MRIRFLAASLAVALGASLAHADTRSDYSIYCFDLFQTDPGHVDYPRSVNGTAGTRPITGGSFSWDMTSRGWMPTTVDPFLRQTADAATSLTNVPVEFGPGCSFFSGTESRIVIQGTKLSAPFSSGTAPAQIRVHYHVILENEYAGSGASVGAVNGVNVNAPGLFDSTSISLTDSGGAALLDAPQGATVTDQSQGPLTRKTVEGEVLVNAMLNYGPAEEQNSKIGITFFAGTQATTANPSVLVTADAAALGGDTAVTDVTSLDPDVVFTVVVPEPGSAALALTACATVALCGRRRRG